MSLKLMKSSLAVLRADKELIIYPLINVASLLTLWTLFAYSSYVTGFAEYLIDAADQNGIVNDPFLYIAVLVFYIFTHFVITFINTALISSALIRLEGGNPTLFDGFKVAYFRFKYIIAWSLLSGTVSFILKVIEKRSNTVQGIVAGIFGLTWGVCSYLVIPFFIKEKLYPISALKKSSQLINKMWGPVLVAEIGFGFLGFLLFLLGFGILWSLPNIGMPIEYAIPITIGYWCILWLLLSTLSSIVVAGIYKYGITGKVPHGFAEGSLKNAFHG